MALELLSVLCTFDSKCNEISFDPHSLLEYLEGLLLQRSKVSCNYVNCDI